MRQHEHQFEEALADQDIAIAARRHNPQAWLARATILENRGRPREALRACAPLRRLTARAVALACACSALGLTGDDQRAAVLLQRSAVKGVGIAAPPRATCRGVQAKGLAPREGPDGDRKADERTLELRERRRQRPHHREHSGEQLRARRHRAQATPRAGRLPE